MPVIATILPTPALIPPQEVSTAGVHRVATLEVVGSSVATMHLMLDYRSESGEPRGRAARWDQSRQGAKGRAFEPRVPSRFSRADLRA